MEVGIVGQDYLKEKMLPMLMYILAYTHTHTPVHSYWFTKRWGCREGSTLGDRSSDISSVCISTQEQIWHTLIPTDTHVRGSASETDAENPRGAGFTGMIISAGLYFRLMYRVFILHFFPEIFPFQGIMSWRD